MAVAFAREREAGERRCVNPAYAEPLRVLGWLSPGGHALAIQAGLPLPGGRGTSRVFALPRTSDSIHVRPLRHGGLAGPLFGSRFRSPARAERELEVLARLRARGSPVPEPVAALSAKRRLGWESVLITRYEPGRDLSQLVAESPGPSEVARIAAAAGRAVRRVHDDGGRHRDLHLGNLVLQPDGRVLIVDWDRGRAGAPASPRERARSLARLYRSVWKRRLPATVRPHAVAAFLHGYLQGDRELWRAVRASLSGAGLQLRLHALGYRLARRRGELR
ncbi:MAG: phosphotransferase [Proteobacteria bacterium]|nr:phosphotransferase [Pseudomonadota bacterium]